ncbi:hypothetical protein COY90_03385 [Candidatus Roizmanbacteria bacterium CG_4_10_14_0_8_um_filter_39_9]|uniref:PIN domain-containing protein n=1 Tax=Candidatus Roizmanbacteria bacterium CG_4_10_14_0_8_um_filter_39_9 TaxID=1974829 RepID=A0A2M7QCF0_9BACT|nr:MAG: hypothetical protein COY90_03385 [Candidatus Roizmanbacteria bacterium CG_4_10_14_0_8_um_filter_39_9]
MKSYFIDTNVILRFLLRDNEGCYKKAVGYFGDAKAGNIQLHLIPEVIFEIDYVLRGVYSIPKQEIVEICLKLVKSPLLKINDRSVLIQALEMYKTMNIDLFDIYLHYFALNKKSTVLSFDRDFEKFKK